MSSIVKVTEDKVTIKVTNETTKVVKIAEGPRGPAGATGGVWRSGHGLPSDTLGVDGDLYIDVDSGDVYQRVLGAYVFQLNIAGTPSGPANGLAGFDNNGDLYGVPGYSFDNDTHSLFADGETDSAMGGVGTTFQREYRPTADSAGVYSNVFQITANVDPDNADFDVGDLTGNGGINGLNLNWNHHNGSTATIGQGSLISGFMDLGDGTAHGVLHNLGGYSIGLDVNSAYELQSYTGYAMYPHFKAGSVITGGGNGFLFNPTFSEDVLGFHGALGGYFNVDAGVSVEHIHVIDSGVTGNAGSRVEEYEGANLYLNNVSARNVTGFNFSSQNVTVDSDGSFNGMNINVQNLQMGGTSQEVQLINMFATGSVPAFTGINFNFEGMTATQGQVNAFRTSGAGIQISALYDTLTTTPVGEFGLNQVGGNFHIAAGHPITSGAFGIGNNFGIEIMADDDMGPDATGGLIGFTELGYTSLLAVATGKTMDTINFSLSGAGLSPDSTGGTVTNVNMYSAVGLLPEGGTVVVPNMTAFLGHANLDNAWSTSLYGVRIDAATAENFMQKSLAIGTSLKKVSTADVGLEVGGRKGVVFASVTTSQKIALSAVAGMQVFDSDLTQMSYFNGVSWVNF